MIKAIDHIHVYCKNVEETAKFFETFLDAKITVRSEKSGNPEVRMDLLGIMVILATATSTDALATREGRRGLDHIGLLVQDLSKTIEEMKKKGGKFSKDCTQASAGVKIAFLEGPDGIHIEIVERS